MSKPTPAHVLPHHPAAGRGILMAVLATIAYAVVDTLSKYQAREYPVGMIVWARYAVPLVVLLLVFYPGRVAACCVPPFPASSSCAGCC